MKMQVFIIAMVVAAAAASKVTPVEQVLNMLSKMKSQGEAEMAAEKKTFAEYAKWVDDTSTTLKQSITTEKAEIESLTAAISKAASDVATLSNEIESLNSEIANMEEDKKESTRQREEDNAEFVKVATDYSESVDALERAIQVMSAQDYDRPAAEMLLQKMAKTSPAMRRVLGAFLQQSQQEPGAPEVAAYEFQSNNIVSMLEGLLDKFKGELSEVQKEETNKRNAYELEQLHLNNLLTEDKEDLERKTTKKAQRAADKAAAEGKLVETKEDLAADEKLLVETQATFAAKTADFEANQKVRTQELEAISKAMEVIKSPELAGNYKKNINLNQESASFLQITSKASTHLVSRNHAVAFLRAKAAKLSSTVLADLVSGMSDSPFAKVITMIEDLLARLKEEAQAEADHKAWCDDQLHKNKSKRDAKTASVNELQAQVQEYEAQIATMAEELKTLAEEIEALTKTMKEATEVRQKEKAENEQAIADAKQGQEATKAALAILREFYSGQSFLQTKQVPEMAAYSGMGGASSGVIGMLEVIQSDFARLQAETTASETQAAKEYDELMSESAANKKEKHESEVKLGLEKDQAEFEMGRTKDELDMTQEELDKANEYFNYLKPSCLEVHVSYEERVQKRKEEIAALKEAYGILNKQ